ncbi:hypothetical protein H6G41_07080 [Tolypothrix sp. FACHB-123]|uniref:hypothetical protein n=1 Tax=Tolypothrix sp. FACHB-123 TaxID=2692868 RepID=UPI001685C4C2|nr:hypothetical protein [Tolypothrix sp. FACHB-123]MBD2354392.1 hypothetical protein [Tolypothrix sp. FACHB-123]
MVIATLVVCELDSWVEGSVGLPLDESTIESILGNPKQATVLMSVSNAACFKTTGNHPL